MPFKFNVRDSDPVKAENGFGVAMILRMGEGHD